MISQHIIRAHNKSQHIQCNANRDHNTYKQITAHDSEQKQFATDNNGDEQITRNDRGVTTNNNSIATSNNG